jgi:hypothetical protein
VPDWLQIASSAGQGLAGLTIFGAVVTFVVQWFRRRSDRKESARQAVIDRERHEAQIAAFRQAENDRLGAQARRIIPAVIPALAFSRTLWNLRIDNNSFEAVTNLHVDIIIRDGDGNEVPHGYRLAQRDTIGKTMLSVFLPEFSQTLDGVAAKYEEFVERIKIGAVSVSNPEEIAAINAQFDNMKIELDERTANVLQAQLNYALTTNLTDDWPVYLLPGRFTGMAIETTKPEYTPELVIRFEDSGSFTWERKSTEAKPRRIHEEMPQKAASTETVRPQFRIVRRPRVR